MEMLFNLPKQTWVDKVIPKHNFESKMTSAKKKLFAAVVAKVRFMYRLSESTTLLPISIFKEIDIIEIEFRSPLLEESTRFVEVV